MGCKELAVMRGSAGNARLMGEMLYAIWFFVLKTGKIWDENDFLIEN